MEAKKAERKYRLSAGLSRAATTSRNVAIVILQGIGALVFSVLVLLLVALLINAGVRWNARRIAEGETASERLERRAQENLLIIGADGEKAVGFLAMRIDREGDRIFGVAIPDGAFLDVPGQGFERVGDAYPAGPDIVASSISNYLTVPFRSYVIVPSSVYREALKRQVVAGVTEASTDSNLDDEALRGVATDLKRVPQKNVALVPLPVKPIKLGTQTYLEPQKEEVADLLKSWWNVDPNAAEHTIRVVVYNGAGKPGIAGEAAQALIRAGMRVIDTQNADRFDYKKTAIIVRRGDKTRGDEVRAALGVGEVSVDESTEDVTDVVVIIGKDYDPAKDEQKGN